MQQQTMAAEVISSTLWFRWFRGYFAKTFALIVALPNLAPWPMPSHPEGVIFVTFSSTRYFAKTSINLRGRP
jgi:hypothetical protein